MTTLSLAFHNMTVVSGWHKFKRLPHSERYVYRGQNNWRAIPIVQGSKFICYAIFDENQKHVGNVGSVNDLP